VTTARRDHGRTRILRGGRGDRALAEQVAAGVDGPCLDLAGPTSLVAPGAVFARLTRVVSADSVHAGQVERTYHRRDLTG
jgi:hypothetical protein